MSDTVKFKLTNGDVFGIYRQTLEQYPNSFLARLITHELNSSFHSRDADNAFVIDEDPMIFSAILTYYRCGVLTIMHDELRQAIIDKYSLPQVHSATSMSKPASTDDPKYIHISNEHPASTAAQTKPHPLQIPALHGCPFVMTYTNSYRSKDPIDVANYLACHGYTMEQIDLATTAPSIASSTTSEDQSAVSPTAFLDDGVTNLDEYDRDRKRTISTPSPRN